MIDMPRRQVLLGDAARRVNELPTAVGRTVITSPPYYMLRNYGVEHQIGPRTSR